MLPKLNFAKKAKAERKFIKEEERRNAYAFQVFLTLRNFLYDEHWLARFSWGSNIAVRKVLKALKKCDKIFFRINVLLGVISTSVYNESDR